MTDEYGFSGSVRYKVPLHRGDEKKVLEVCADSSLDAEKLAIFIASDEDYVIWDTDEDDVELDGIAETVIVDDDSRLAWQTHRDEMDRL